MRPDAFIPRTRSSTRSNLQACNLADKRVESLTWATQLSLEMGQALVESLLNGGTHR